MNAQTYETRMAKSLLDEIDTLREENRQLRALLLPALDVPGSWRLSEYQHRILRALHGGRGGYVSRERLYAAVYEDSDKGPDMNTLHAIKTHLNTKLRRHCPGVVIEHVREQGWRLSPQSLAALATAVEAERAAYGRILPTARAEGTRP